MIDNFERNMTILSTLVNTVVHNTIAIPMGFYDPALYIGFNISVYSSRYRICFDKDFKHLEFEFFVPSSWSIITDFIKEWFD